MRSMRALWCGAIVGLGVLAGAAWGADQRPMTFKTKLTERVELDYLLHLPAGYEADKAQNWPLILFLHGAGERGSDLELVKKHGPPKLIAAGQDIPAIVASPQCPTGEWWNDHVDGLLAMLDDLAKRYRVDPDRVYVTGISMGGFGTWALLARAGERFAAAAPICGGGNLIGLQRALQVPIWAFHGDADPVVPVSESQRLVDLLERRGSTVVKLTTYPGVDHDSWTRTYEDPAMWEWLFAQRKGR